MILFDARALNEYYIHGTLYVLPLCRAFRKCESRKRMGSWFIGEQKNFRCARVTDAARTSDELGGRLSLHVR